MNAQQQIDAQVLERVKREGVEISKAYVTNFASQISANNCDPLTVSDVGVIAVDRRSSKPAPITPVSR